MPSYANQTTWTADPPIGLPGQIANEEKYNGISRTVETAAGLSFGQPAYRGTADRGVIIGGTYAATGAGSEPAAGNVGTSTITDAPAVVTPAKQGRYRFVQTATSATSPLFAYDPDGVFVGEGAVGTEFTIDGITATVTAAGTATAGDTFYVDVTYTTNAKFMGLAVLTSAYQAPPSGGTAITDGYPQYSDSTLMTEGTMYVTAGASVADGDDVYWNPATGRYTNTTTHIRIPTAKFDSTSTNGNIVKLSLDHRFA